MSRRILAAVLFCASTASLSAAQPLKVLYVAGGGYHDYPTQAKLITEGVATRANVVFTVKHLEGGRDAPKKHPAYEGSDWAKGFDVVVHNICNAGDVNDLETVENIARAHEGGIPAVFIHCSMHCYRLNEGETWQKLIGITTKNHEAHHPETVTRIADDHPITRAFPKNWTTPNGELYRVLKVWENTTVLATAQASEKKDHPVVWVNTYGRGRVFGTTLGHHNETVATPEFLGLVTRGVLWAAGKLNDDGAPAEGFGPASEARAWVDSVEFPANEKPVDLFNGKDFTGWEGHTDKYWSIDNGVIVGQNSAENAPKVSTYLLTTKPYKNFRLVFESKLVESEMHSGVAIWGRKYAHDGEAHSYQGHLVMFPAPYGYYDLFRRNHIVPDDGRGAKAGKQHDWNKIEILAINNRIRYVVNGQLATDWSDPMPDLCQPGPIGLQLHSNTVPQRVEFRGLRLSENPEDRLITAAP